MAVLALLALRHITTSPFGQTLRMIRDNENRASFLGVVLWRARLWAFTIAGAFAGLGAPVARSTARAGRLASFAVSGDPHETNADRTGVRRVMYPFVRLFPQPVPPFPGSRDDR